MVQANRIHSRQPKRGRTSSVLAHKARMTAAKSYRISGHETFPCRYTWLPKAVRGLREKPKLFSNDEEEQAMVDLGVGKNMVRSIRFWSQAAGVATAGAKGGGQLLTKFG